MLYKIPIQCGTILYRTEVVKESTSKSTITYKTRKRFAITWMDGTISEKYPTDNDYYHYVIGQKICYDRPEIMSNYGRTSEDDSLVMISILFLIIFGIRKLIIYYDLL